MHWRVRDFSTRRKNYDSESLARNAWGEPLLRYGITIQDKDLCVGSVPITWADEASWRILSNITQERHRASTWLLDMPRRLYEVTVDT